MMLRLQSWLRRPVGATVGEYMILLVLIAVFVMAAIRLMGSTLSEKVERANAELDTAMASDEERRAIKAERFQKGVDERRGEGEGGRSSSGSTRGGGSGSSSGADRSSSSPSSSSSSSGTGGSSGRSGSGSRADKGSAIPDGGDGLGDAESGSGDGPGFHPAVLLAAFGLLGVLGYVMVKGKS